MIHVFSSASGFTAYRIFCKFLPIILDFKIAGSSLSWFGVNTTLCLITSTTTSAVLFIIMSKLWKGFLNFQQCQCCHVEECLIEKYIQIKSHGNRSKSKFSFWQYLKLLIFHSGNMCWRNTCMDRKGQFKLWISKIWSCKPNWNLILHFLFKDWNRRWNGKDSREDSRISEEKICQWCWGLFYKCQEEQ